MVEGMTWVSKGEFSIVDEIVAFWAVFEIFGEIGIRWGAVSGMIFVDWFNVSVAGYRKNMIRVKSMMKKITCE